jgi:tRNA1Val (adenine37-N6)-methyltransferase
MPPFKFKKFTIHQENSALKVGTDAMVFGALIDTKNHEYCLDIGTGTGVLSLMVAQKNENLRITAIEIDRNACKDALLNFNNSVFTNSFHLINNDFFVHEFNQKYDLIISNPPFFNDSFPSPNQLRRVARNSNQEFANCFFSKNASIITELGKLWLILPSDQVEFWTRIAMIYGFKLIFSRSIFAKPEKLIRNVCVYTIGNSIPDWNEDVFCIRTINGLYTDQYIKMTSEFHDRIPIK